MDREYVKGLSLDEALGIIDNCIKELHTRFLIAQKNFVIKVRYASCVRFCLNMVLLDTCLRTLIIAISKEYLQPQKVYNCGGII